MQPPGTGTRIYGGEPPSNGRPVEREKEQMAYFQTLENSIFHTIWCSPLLQGVCMLNILFLHELIDLFTWLIDLLARIALWHWHIYHI